jgi:hypothetical protein
MPLPRRLDIHWSIVEVRTSRDQRPCIIVESGAGETVFVAPLSSQLDLYDRSRHFLIESSDPDFPATGLRKSCFVLGDFLRDIPASSVGKLIGRLEGDLALRFVEWIG